MCWGGWKDPSTVVCWGGWEDPSTLMCWCGWKGPLTSMCWGGCKGPLTVMVRVVGGASPSICCHIVVLNVPTYFFYICIMTSVDFCSCLQNAYWTTTVNPRWMPHTYGFLWHRGRQKLWLFNSLQSGDSLRRHQPEHPALPIVGICDRRL